MTGRAAAIIAIAAAVCRQLPQDRKDCDLHPPQAARSPTALQPGQLVPHPFDGVIQAMDPI